MSVVPAGAWKGAIPMKKKSSPPAAIGSPSVTSSVTVFVAAAPAVRTGESPVRFTEKAPAMEEDAVNSIRSTVMGLLIVFFTLNSATASRFSIRMLRSVERATFSALPTMGNSSPARWAVLLLQVCVCEAGKVREMFSAEVWLAS